MAAEIDPAAYEETVLSIIRDEIARDCPGTQYTIRHDQSVPGESGHDHQIDITVEITCSGTRVLMLVECKCYSERRVTNEEVQVLASRLGDTGAHKGLIVTTIGFQKGAKTIARSKGIALVVTGTDASTPGWDVIIPIALAALLIRPVQAVVTTCKRTGIKIYAGNLPYGVDEEALRELFSQHGLIDDAVIAIDRFSGRSKGFGFVTMPDAAAAHSAIKALDGFELSGRSLRVTEAKAR